MGRPQAWPLLYWGRLLSIPRIEWRERRRQAKQLVASSALLRLSTCPYIISRDPLVYFWTSVFVPKLNVHRTSGIHMIILYRILNSPGQPSSKGDIWSNSYHFLMQLDRPCVTADPSLMFFFAGSHPNEPGGQVVGYVCRAQSTMSIIFPHISGTSLQDVSLSFCNRAADRECS